MEEGGEQTGEPRLAPDAIPAWLAVAFDFGSECWRDRHNLEPLDVLFLACTAGASLGIPALASPGRVEQHHAEATLRTVLAIFGGHPSYHLIARLGRLRVPSPSNGPEAVARALWQPYWRWWSKMFLSRAPGDKRIEAVQRRYKAFADQHIPPLVANENVLRSFRGAMRQAARNAKVGKDELWKFARKDAGFDDVVSDKTDGIVAGTFLHDLGPHESDGKSSEGWLRVGTDGLLRWNHNKAADRLARALKARWRDPSLLPESGLSPEGEPTLFENTSPDGEHYTSATPTEDPAEAAAQVELTRIIRQLRETHTEPEIQAVCDWLSTDMSQDEAAALHGVSRKALRHRLPGVAEMVVAACPGYFEGAPQLGKKK